MRVEPKIGRTDNRDDNKDCCKCCKCCRGYDNPVNKPAEQENSASLTILAIAIAVMIYLWFMV